MENYFNKVMISGFELLVEDTILWPDNLDLQHRIALLNQAIEYFKGEEQFTKCALLKKKVQEIKSYEERFSNKKKRSLQSRH
jgi:hypothetical protein